MYNLNRGLTEKFGRLLVAFADDYREVEEVTAGNIVVLSGLKASRPRIRWQVFELCTQKNLPKLQYCGIVNILRFRFQFFTIYVSGSGARAGSGSFPRPQKAQFFKNVL